MAPLTVEGVEVAVNRYFLGHAEIVLGSWSRKDTLYGGEGYSVTGNGDLARQLQAAVVRLPEFTPSQPSPVVEKLAVAFTPPPTLPHIGEGSFFVGDNRTICQSVAGQSVVVRYGGRTLTAYGTRTGKRLAALVGLRDRARRVLQSQNDGWPEKDRVDARRVRRHLRPHQ